MVTGVGGHRAVQVGIGSGDTAVAGIPQLRTLDSWKRRVDIIDFSDYSLS